MFPGITEHLQGYVDQVRPVAQEAVNRLDVFSHRVLARLDRIADAVEADERIYERIRPQLTLAAGASDVIDTVPAGEAWVLESVTMVPSGAVGTPGGVTLGLSDGLPLWGGNHPGRPATAGGSGVRFESGHAIRALAAEVGVTVVLQVRTERPMPRMRAIAGGREVPADVPHTPPNTEQSRHTGTWFTAAR